MKRPIVRVTAILGAATVLAAFFATDARSESKSFRSSAGPIEVSTSARGLVHPWGLALLPDGRILVTERPGRFRIVSRDGDLSPPLKNVPEVWASDQGGLLDVVLDKSFAGNKTLYFCFAGGRKAAGEPPLLAPHWMRIGFKTSRSSSGRRARCRRAITMAAASRKLTTATCS